MKLFVTIKKENELPVRLVGKIDNYIKSLGKGRIEITIKKIRGTRTRRQNNALHLYFQLLADELNKAGLDMKKILKPSVDIDWTLESIKEYLWRPIQFALLRKRSTTQLKSNEIDEVYNQLNRFLGEKFGVHVEFPHEEPIEGLDY